MDNEELRKGYSKRRDAMRSLGYAHGMGLAITCLQLSVMSLSAERRVFDQSWPSAELGRCGAFGRTRRTTVSEVEQADGLEADIADSSREVTFRVL